MSLKDLLKTEIRLRTPPVKRMMAHGARDWRGPFYLRKARRQRDLVHVLTQLRILLRTNVSLSQGLENASLDAPNAKVEALLLTLRDDILNGASISEAMRVRSRFFPSYVSDLVAAGERTGAVVEALLQARDMVSAENRTATRWLQMLSYVWVVLVFELSLGAFCLIKVFPVFTEILSEVGAAPPQGFLFSPFLIARVMIVLTAFTASCLLMLRFRVIADRVSDVFLHLPLVRRLPQTQNLALWCSALGALLKGGVPVTDALYQVERMTLSGRYRRATRVVRAHVEEGGSMQDAMSRMKHLFPTFLQSTVGLGEDSGRIAEALSELGDQLYDTHRRNLSVVLDLLKPCVIVMLGVVPLWMTINSFIMMTIMAEAMMVNG